MKSIKAKRQQSSVIILGLSLIGMASASLFKEAAFDTVVTFQAIMALSMVVGIIGLIEK
jgi:hypothetical protein